MCPDNDIQNISLVFEAKDTDKMIDTLAALAEAMSEGYEKQQKYINPSYKPQPLTQEEVLSLTINELSDLQNELMNEIGAGMATDVDAEPEKTKLKKTDEATE